MAGLNGLARALAALLVLASIVFATSAIAASSRVCRQLEAELASAGSGGGGSAQFRRYDAALSKQRQQLSAAKGNARAAGCGFSLFGSNVQQCARINANVQKMERNVDTLQRKRDQSAGRGGGRSRATILASLNANGCRNQVVARQPFSPRTDNSDRGNYLVMQPQVGTGERRQTIDNAPVRTARQVAKPNQASGMQTPSGQYRTVCVRTCDGYYFPMSFASSKREFARDQQNCQAMCPGAEMQVFFHQSSPAAMKEVKEGEEAPEISDESADMVSSVSGKPYSEMPNAYLYKRETLPKPEGCSCNAPKNFEVIAGNPPPSSEATSSTAPNESPSILPVAPPAAQETHASSIQKLGPEPAAQPAETKPSELAPLDPNRKVRVVGPVFLPDPEGAIDLRAPAQRQVP
ncbi:DUF2865 domain-containing protein [Mesorhizobium sp. CGMCC 1.15528]|uniref:DUF2865 domain-containing protein n=1 Tax=Mesorhizobium zhangyense TaxID=1776730 RepID=A0A7C9R487_9HYPH|nr:DUF2865 domain-containing protein [Mesorhizobium zhangyense]NGN39579.1 DUF2865 domain-containing protein [Mesorhizobium zhangyense]